MTDEGRSNLATEFLRHCVFEVAGPDNQARTAQKIGCTENYLSLSLWLNGKRAPRDGNLRLIAAFLFKEDKAEKDQSSYERKEGKFIAAIRFFRRYDNGEISLDDAPSDYAWNFLVATGRRDGAWPLGREKALGKKVRSRKTIPVAQFMGRETEIGEIGKAVENNDRVMLTGTPGIGKSTLCRNFCELYKDEYKAIWWLEARDLTSLLRGFGELYEELLLDDGLNHELPYKAQRVIEYIEADAANWLLIFDDFLERSESLQLIPKGAKVIATSRTPCRSFSLMEIRALDFPSSVALLNQRSHRELSQSAARGLVQLLDRNPLGLSIAGSWLADMPATSIDEYITKVRKIVQVSPSRVGIYDYNDAIHAAILLSSSKLSRNAKILLLISSYLEGSQLSSHLFSLLSERRHEESASHGFYSIIPEDLWILSEDHGEVQAAIFEISRSSLLEIMQITDSEVIFSVHNLTQISTQVCSNELLSPSISWGEVSTAFVAGIFPNNPSLPTSFDLCEALLPHCEKMFDLDHVGLAGDLLFNNAATTLRLLGMSERSTRYLTRARDLVIKRNGRLHPESIRVRINRAMSDFDREEWQDGLVGFWGVLEDARHLVKTIDLPVEVLLTCLSNFATSLKQMARVSENLARESLLGVAADLDLEVIKHCRSDPSIPLRVFQQSAVGLAGTRLLQGRNVQALRLFHALAMRCAADTKDLLTVYRVLMPFAKAMVSTGRTLQGYKGHLPLEVFALCEQLIVSIHSRQVLEELFDVRSWSVICHLVHHKLKHLDPARSIDHIFIARKTCDHMGFDISEFDERARSFAEANKSLFPLDTNY